MTGTTARVLVVGVPGPAAGSVTKMARSPARTGWHLSAAGSSAATRPGAGLDGRLRSPAGRRIRCADPGSGAVTAAP